MSSDCPNVRSRPDKSNHAGYRASKMLCQTRIGTALQQERSFTQGTFRERLSHRSQLFWSLNLNQPKLLPMPPPSEIVSTTPQGVNERYTPYSGCIPVKPLGQWFGCSGSHLRTKEGRRLWMNHISTWLCEPCLWFVATYGAGEYL